MDQSGSEWLFPQEIGDVPIAGFFDEDGAFNQRVLAEYIVGEANYAMPVIPAFEPDGKPTIPPETHVRDHLARVLNLVDDETQLQYAVAPRTVHVALGKWNQKCDFCDEIARYDGTITLADGTSGGAWMCLEHASLYVSTLGEDACYVMLSSEVPARLRAAVDMRCTQIGRAPVFG